MLRREEVAFEASVELVIRRASRIKDRPLIHIGILQESAMKSLRVVYNSHHLGCDVPQRSLHSSERPRPAEVSVEELAFIATSLSDAHHLDVVQFELAGRRGRDLFEETARPAAFKDLPDEVAAVEVTRNVLRVQSSALADVRPAFMPSVRNT
ncbi:hypothetical protein P9139_04260 [Curtobacterium flaccumfaciens]|nr:hypothetical protein P9139_04260 [Curtobacterium flaccumfaciens]